MSRRSRLLTPYNFIFNNRNWIPFHFGSLYRGVYIFSTLSPEATNEKLWITNYGVTNQMKIVTIFNVPEVTPGRAFLTIPLRKKKGTEYWLWIVLLRTVTIENSLQYRTLIDDIFVKLHLSIDNAWSSYAKEQNSSRKSVDNETDSQTRSVSILLERNAAMNTASIVRYTVLPGVLPTMAYREAPARGKHKLKWMKG